MSERDEGGQISVGASNFLDKIEARIPHQQPRPPGTEDTKSIATVNRARGRYLYIANPGSDNSSDEEDRNRIQPPPKPSSSSYNQSYVHQPPALPQLPPPTALQRRSPVIDQIRVFVTTDADQYLLVDVVGSSSGAAIRERIFTKVRYMVPFQVKLYFNMMAGSYMYPTKIRNITLSIGLHSALMRWESHF
ncbi:hypothetical protein FIBSPDRAFT_163424 [Athelia psychrophila]|uniref:Uncharacterized protein n=1 Tax=Athelia psychrophila TaxID=1759441 RepID=A0A166SY69_9AGAM|nr:hypothetical protein FIBSPDRAFT_163424 [Fibularhizoctonia sp. CBS 109695]